MKGVVANNVCSGKGFPDVSSETASTTVGRRVHLPRPHDEKPSSAEAIDDLFTEMDDFNMEAFDLDRIQDQSLFLRDEVVANQHATARNQPSEMHCAKVALKKTENQAQAQTQGAAQERQKAANIAENSGEKAQIDQIKAEMMWNMVEKIPDGVGGYRKVLFLTNAQAGLISGSQERVKKLIDELEIPSPQLFINLLPSWGGTDCIRLMKSFNCDPLGADNPFLCLNRGSSPWDSDEEAAAAECRICRFLSEVVIKLAIDTNAIILCGGLAGVCTLTNLMHRMVELESAKWGGNPPFTIIYYCNLLDPLYRNPKDGLIWQQIRNGSSNWQAKDPLIQRLIEKEECPPLFTTDLESGQYYLIVDSIEEGPEGEDVQFVDEPFQQLLSELTAYLQSIIPTINLKTGASIRELDYTKHSGGLGAAVDAVSGNSPVIFLDARLRPELELTTREGIIRQAKNWWVSELNDRLMDRKPAEPRGSKKATPNFMDVMALAYFRDVLFGDGNPIETAVEVIQIRVPTPLHEVILESEVESCMLNVGERDVLEPASKEKVREVVLWLARSFYSDCWEILDSGERAKLEAEGIDFETHYEAQFLTWVQHAECLLNNDKFLGINVIDVDGAQNLVRKLVSLDKLPLANPIEGLRLLRAAWDEYDVGMHNAAQYKILSKILFAFQLLVQILIVFCTSATTDSGSFGFSRRLGLYEACNLLPHTLGIINASLTTKIGNACPSFVQSIDRIGTHERYLFQASADDTNANSSNETTAHLVFVLSIIASTLISFSSYFKPLRRWRNLRSGVIALKSIIWQYRSRAGPFGISPENPGRPEQILCDELTAWRADFAGFEDQASAIEKIYRPNVYKHYQYEGYPTEPTNPLRGREHTWTDDHQSPARPQAYLNLRLLPAMEFYQRRLPWYSWTRVFWTIAALLFTVTSAVLAYSSETSYVILVSAVSSSICSWVQFRGLDRKIDRYNCAVRQIKNLTAWWDSLSDAEKASPVNISDLVLQGEANISNENATWNSSKSLLAKSNSGKQS